MKYGFFGGAFNPPTCAHLELAKQVIKELSIDKIFFVPVGNLYQKENLIDEKYRYEMLEKLCSKYEFLEVSNLEMNLKNNLKAIDVFEIIIKTYKEKIEKENLEIFFIMGSDNLVKMKKWKDAEKLISKYKYIILDREENDIEEIFKKNELLNKYKSNFKILEKNKQEKVSSTKVREYIKQNDEKKVCEMIPEEIYEYIKDKKLYI